MSVARELADLPSASPSTDANFDNGTFVIDVSENKVGIGTTAPIAKLNIFTADSGVTPSTSADELFVENSGHAGITIGSGSSSGGYLFFGDSEDNGTGQISYNHNGNYMAFATNGAEKVRILTGGYVGIGTDAPDHLIEIVHADTTAVTGANIASNSCAGLHIDKTGDTDTAGSVLKLTSNSDGCQSAIAHIQVDDNDAVLAFYTDGGGTLNEAMRITDAQKVGIGTTAPKTLLTVEGTITLKEQAAAGGDTAAYGQLWVKNTAPNSLYFTGDTGIDQALASTGKAIAMTIVFGG